jgi:acyl-CoA synthetase (AMP-forming)/AMP-acid ligase II
MVMRAGGTHAEVVRFADELERHGSAPAVVDEHGRTCTYADLASRADDVAERLGATRRLVLLEAANDLDTITSLVGAYRAGHVVLLVGADPARSAEIVTTYEPDVLVGAGGLVERRPGSAHDLHPQLRLLLSTSGSTGSPKLVRLSGEALDANARAIASYLALRPDDRSITSLPLQYCYGLSVLNSHLAAGASIVCTAASVVDPCFWAAVDQQRVTNVAGVPHTFELLDRGGFAERSHPSLRFLTQAGGRMAPGDVRRWARLGQRRGFDLFVMYGQTEATARMAYLPPDLAETHPDSVGLPVPGGSFRLEPIEGTDAGEGELVYSGPNVMLGYAQAPTDLALGRTLDELHTGDLARIGDDGLVRIVGRRKDVLKIYGLRVDLGRIRTRLADAGMAVTCGGDDEGIAIAVHDHTPVESVRAAVADVVELPAGAVAVAPLPEPPRLANGKLDGAALVAIVRSHDSETRATGTSPSALLGALLGVVDPAPEQTFVSLGGDSLTYVEASIALEDRLGHLPDAWHLRTMADLDRLDRSPSGRRATARLETGVVLRALAIVLVVGSHTGTFLVGGGAHLLFAVAGFNMARFQLRSGAWGRSLARFVVPSVLWIGGVAALTDDFDLAHALLVHGWVGGPGRWAYWFVEVLAQVLVAVAVVLRVPAVRRFEQRHPIGFPALLLVPALAVRFDLIELGSHHRPFFRPHEIAWIFILGWLAATVRTTGQRAAVSAVAVASIPGFFGNPTRELVLLTGLLLLLWVPTLPMPRIVAPLVGTVASASLYVYLTHVQVHPLVSGRSPVLGLVVSLATGVAVWCAAQPLQARLERVPARLRSRFAPLAQ